MSTPIKLQNLGGDSFGGRALEAPTVVVPVAGAFNFGPSGAMHFKGLRHAIEEQGIPVTRTIVPRALGLIGCMDSLYQKFNEDVENALHEHGPFAQPLYVAHSLGGLPALRSHALSGSAGILTLGSPHGHMRDVPLLPKPLRKFEPYSRRCEDFEEFSQETMDILLQDDDRTENVIFAGSTIDEIVPVTASVPAVTGVRRVLMGPRRIPRGFEDVEHIPTGLVEHARLLTHRAATDFIVNNVVQMVDPLHDMPIPDNVINVDFANRSVLA
jgi:hypothetical protein